MERPSLLEEILSISQKNIIGNMRLADMATGIGHHPKPIEVTLPLISKEQHKAENPYISNTGLPSKKGSIKIPNR